MLPTANENQSKNWIGSNCTRFKYNFSIDFFILACVQQPNPNKHLPAQHLFIIEHIKWTFIRWGYSKFVAGMCDLTLIHLFFQLKSRAVPLPIQMVICFLFSQMIWLIYTCVRPIDFSHIKYAVRGGNNNIENFISWTNYFPSPTTLESLLSLYLSISTYVLRFSLRYGWLRLIQWSCYAVDM